MNTQLFKKYITFAGFALMALMVLSEFTELFTGILYLIALSTSAITIGAEMGKSSDWEVKEWWQYVMIALNVLFVGAFTIGVLIGILGLM